MKTLLFLQKGTKHQLSFWLLFIFTALLLSLIPLYRFVVMDGWPEGQEPYFHLRIGHILLSQEIPTIDPANIVQQEYSFDPFDLLLGTTAALFGDRFAAFLIPFLLGLATLFFLFQIYKSLFSHPQQQLFCGLLTAVNPVFLQLFTHANSLSFLSFIVTLCAWFFTVKKKIAAPLFLFVLIFFYEIHHLIVLLFLLLCLSFYFQRLKEGIQLIILLFISLVFLFFIQQPLLLFHSFSLYSFFQQTVADLGAGYGISIFSVLLALLGILVLRKEKKVSFATLSLLLFILFLVLFVNSSYLLYTIPFLSIAGTIGFFSLLTKEWKLQSLQNVTLLLLVLGVLFSTVSFLSRTAATEPTLSTIQALQWLKQNSYENAVILTSYDYVSVTQYLTERRVILDPDNDPYHKTRTVEKQIQQLYHTRNLEEAEQILERYQIDYIVLFPSMLQGEIWIREDEGLLFLLENGDNFKRIYYKDGITIWSVRY